MASSPPSPREDREDQHGHPGAADHPPARPRIAAAHLLHHPGEPAPAPTPAGGRSSSAHSAGDRVSALTDDGATATQIVTGNCVYGIVDGTAMTATACGQDSPKYCSLWYFSHRSKALPNVNRV